jgi:O-antigen/teichoic acid export membrane protein
VTDDPKPRSASRDAMRTLFFNGAAAAVGIVTGIIVAKTLGPTGKGYFSGLALLQSGATSALSGFGASITYFLSRHKRTAVDLFGPLVLVFAIISVVQPIVLLLWGWRFGFTPVIVVFAATSPATVVVAWQQGIYLGLDRVTSLNSQILGFAVFLLVMVGAALAMHLGLAGALWAWALTTYGAAAVVMLRVANLLRCKPSWDFREALRSIAKYASSATVGSILGFFNYRIDSLVLIGFLGAPGFGVYSVAVSAGEVLFRIPRAVATATTYRVGASAFEDSALTTARSIRTCTALVVAATLPLYVLAPWLVQWFYGPQFAEAAPALRILLPGIVLFVSVGLFSPFFTFQMGRPIVVVYMSLCMIALQTGLGFWLVPIYQLEGAAIASTSTYIVSAIIVTIYFCRLTKLNWVDVWILRKEDLKTLRRLLPRDRPSERASSGR